MLLFFFFFFSSRRRHTRFDCDWSSDVCSSDLAVPIPSEGAFDGRSFHACDRPGAPARGGRAAGGTPGRLSGADARRQRSEEHTSELQSQSNLVCRLLLEKKKTERHRKRGRLAA